MYRGYQGERASDLAATELRLTEELRAAAVEAYESIDKVCNSLHELAERGQEDPRRLIHALRALKEQDRLFQPELRVRKFLLEIGIRNNNFSSGVRIYLDDLTFVEYVEKLRIITARRLIIHTDMSFSSISGAVGYLSYKSFIGACRRWTGGSPKEIRGEAENAPFEYFSVDTLLAIERGRLSSEEQQELLNRLRILYPATFGRVGMGKTIEVTPLFDAASFERYQMESVIWPKLCAVPYEEQRVIAAELQPKTTAVFRFLHEKSRTLGRRDRNRGIEVAQLALDSLDGAETHLGPMGVQARIEAEGWLGNAYRLAVNLPVAEPLIRRAVAGVQDGSVYDKTKSGIIYTQYGALEMFKRKYDPAVEAFAQAIRLFEEAGNTGWTIDVLIQRADVFIRADQVRSAEEDLRNALKKAHQIGHSEFIGQATLDLAILLTRSGFHHQAKSCIAELDADLFSQNEVYRLRARWIRAVIEHNCGNLNTAESEYLTAWNDLQHLDIPMYSALLPLDMAALYLDMGEVERVMHYASVCLVHCQAYQIFEETAAILELLRIAITEAHVTNHLLLDLKSVIQRDDLIAMGGQGPQ